MLCQYRVDWFEFYSWVFERVKFPVSVSTSPVEPSEIALLMSDLGSNMKTPSELNVPNYGIAKNKSSEYCMALLRKD